MKPYKSVLHECILAWLGNQKLEAFCHGKPSRAYFICRHELLQFDLQTVESILAMLKQTSWEIPLEKLHSQTMNFIREKNSFAGDKEYNIDVNAFIRRNGR